MASKPESRLQRRIRKALQKAFPGSFWFKVHGGPFQRAGIPDLLGCVQGCYIALEVKRPGHEPTQLQLDTIDLILEAGGYATDVTSPQEAIKYVTECLNDLRQIRSTPKSRR